MKSNFSNWKFSLAATGVIAAFALSQGAHAQNLAPLKTTTVSLDILTNAQGLTLYTFDPDAAGKSNCNGGCAKEWPPLMSDGTAVQAPLSIITRDDGTKQIAFKGHPLYTYDDDQHAGDIDGDGLGGIWHVVHP